MPEESEVQVPGTKSKIPVKWLAIGAVVIVIYILMTKGQGQDQTDQSGLLASELDQRLKEQWEALQNALGQAQQPSSGVPITPPTTGLTPPPTPITTPPGHAQPPFARHPGILPGMNVVHPPTPSPVPSGPPERHPLPPISDIVRRKPGQPPVRMPPERTRARVREDVSPFLREPVGQVSLTVAQKERQRIREREKKSPALKTKRTTKQPAPSTASSTKGYAAFKPKPLITAGKPTKKRR